MKSRILASNPARDRNIANGMAGFQASLDTIELYSEVIRPPG